jgi:hypothetical protein
LLCNLTAAQAATELAGVLGLFPLLLPDTPAIFPEWRRLVVVHQALGKNGHDARLVAAMRVHGLTHLLSFNAADFVRYTGTTALDPAGILPASP